MMPRTLPTILLILVIGSTAAVGADPLEEVARRINAERRQRGLPKLATNEKLAKAAQSQADWMAQVGTMTHLRGQEATSFEEWKRSHYHPVNRIIHAGYVDWQQLFSLEVRNGQQVLVAKPGANDHVGEVIAHGNPQSGPRRFQPRVIVAGWINSPGHRKDLLGEQFEDIGVGLAQTQRGDAYWCVVFAKK